MINKSFVDSNVIYNWVFTSEEPEDGAIIYDIIHPTLRELKLIDRIVAHKEHKEFYVIHRAWKEGDDTKDKYIKVFNILNGGRCRESKLITWRMCLRRFGDSDYTETVYKRSDSEEGVTTSDDEVIAENREQQ